MFALYVKLMCLRVCLAFGVLAMCRGVFADDNADWAVAVAAFRENYSRIPALKYSRRQEIVSDASRSPGKDLPQEQAAEIWDEEGRRLIVGRYRTSRAESHFWRCIDGRVAKTMLSKHKLDGTSDGLPVLNLGTDIGTRVRCASEWTVRRGLGKDIGGHEFSLFDIAGNMESQIVGHETIDSEQCIVGAFERILIPGPVSEVSWRIEATLGINSGNLHRLSWQAGQGEVTELNIREHAQVADGLGGHVTIPVKLEFKSPRRTEIIDFLEIAVLDHVEDGLYEPTLVTGTQVLDLSKQGGDVSFVGGERGERLFYESHGAPELFLKAKFEKDPGSFRELVETLQPQIKEVALLHGPASERRTAYYWGWGIVLIAAMATGVWWRFGNR